MTHWDWLADRWLEIVPRMTLGLAASALVVEGVVRRWPAISPEWRHRLWAAVVFQGLLWVTIPLVHTEVVTLGSPAVSTGEAAGRTSIGGADTQRRLGASAETAIEPLALAGSSVSFDWARATFIAWLVGVVSIAGWFGVTYQTFQRRLADESVAGDDALSQAAADQAQRLGLRRTPEVRLSRLCGSPFVFGLWRPTIYLPDRLTLAASERDALLAHELAHVKRRDALIEILSLAACILNLFNPAIWWARRQLSHARERCVDRTVVEACRHAAHTYAGALLHVAESLAMPSRTMGLTSGRSAGELLGRIEDLLATKPASPRLFPARLALAGLALATIASLVTIRRETVVMAEQPVPLSQDAAITPASKASQPELLLARADEPKLTKIELQPIRHEELIKGLKFLAADQREDGSFQDAYGSNVGVVSLAGLAFIGAGSRPQAGEFQKPLARSIGFVKRSAREDGYFQSQGNAKPGSMYDHGFALLFLSRVYPFLEGKDKDEMKELIDKAVKLSVAAQGADGSWRYQPTPAPNGDLTVGVCQVTGLEAARQAGFKVPQATFNAFAAYLKQSQLNDGGYRYILGNGTSSFPRTGAGLYASYLVGHGDEAAPTALKYLEQNRAAAGAAMNYYGNWYAAQAMSRAGGERAKNWHRAVGDTICRNQTDRGSWYEFDSPSLGTALACLALESPVFDAVGRKVNP